MKLNTKQPYGHIYGNHAATFTQNGKFFDGSGTEIDEEGLQKDKEVEEEDQTLEQAKEFLQTLLAGTKMTKAKIVKEAEIQGFSWHVVEQAADLMDVIKFKVGVVANWKLNEEE